MGLYLSIIIPMYNCEKYIANCLDSILESDLPSELYEIIVINDGSKDKGPEIAQDYASRYDNIIYLSQENQGQSAARNYGFRKCRGKYVWFVDGDDYLESKLQKLCNEILKYKQLDILVFKLRYVTEKLENIAIVWDQKEVTHNTVISGRQALIEGYAPTSVCIMLIRKQFLIDNSIMFREGIINEDTELSIRLFCYAQKVLLIDYVPYVYIRHLNSSIMTNSPDKIAKRIVDNIYIVDTYNELAEKYFLCDRNLSENLALRKQNLIFGIVYSLYTNKKEWKPIGVNNTVISKFKEEGLYPLKGPFDSWKKTIFSKVLNCEFVIK